MAYIIEVPNSFQPLVGVKKHIHPGGITIRQWLQQDKPGFVEFEQPTICLINGQPILRTDWDTRVIEEKDIVNFITIVGIVPLIIIIVLVVVMIVISLNNDTPKTPGTTPESDPVYTTKGQSNGIRLGEPIEVNYGRNRVYPSLASVPFFRYSGNDQFQYALFCIGQGLYDIEEIRIGDTNINNFAEVQYEILEPGEKTTLFRTNVYTAPEVGAQELYAPNDEEWSDPGYIGPFPVCQSGDVVDKIELDLVYPEGMFGMDKAGDMWEDGVFIEFNFREIDELGNALGDWIVYMDSFVAKTNTPQRRTIVIDFLPQGRYEVRARRPYNRNTDETNPESGGNGNRTEWDGMRGFVVGEEPDFGDVTLLAIAMRATNNLNYETQDDFNVICTRKLPIREGSAGWSEPVATRSIVWAFVDVFRSVYGGQVDDDAFFDWDALEELDALFTSRGEYFDWCFRDAVTVWEAAKAVAVVGRVVPMLSGSLITMRRDGPLEVPVTLFTPDNIIKGSFEWDIVLWEPNDPDGIRIEYTEVSTGYKQEQVLCVLPDEAGENPEDVRLSGCQDRDHAYRYGMYLAASKRYLRENIIFETGMEGFIPSYGDLVAISHDVPRWGQSGYVVAVDDSSEGYYHLHVSEPLNFEESGQVYQIMLRAKNGDILGPFTAIENSDPSIVSISTDEEGSDPIDFLTGGTTEPMLFLFGISGQVTKYGRVIKIEPQGGERIKITLVNDDPIVHSFDSLTAPPLTVPSLPPTVPDLPEVTRLVLRQLSGSYLTIQATWTAAFGATSYLVQISYDDTTWTQIAITSRPALQFQAQPGLLYVRVAAMNKGQGPWLEESIIVSMVSGLTAYVPWTALSWEISWWQKENVDAWQIKVYDNRESGPVLKRTDQQTTLTYLYDYAKALTDGNLTREMYVEVDSLIRDDVTGLLVASELPKSLELSNSIPNPPIHLGYEYLGEDSSGGDSVRYRLFWDLPAEDDTHRVRVWVSTNPVLDPEDTSLLVYEFTAASPGYAGLPEEVTIDIPLESPAGHPTYYFWVAVYDVWGEETMENFESSGGPVGNLSEPCVIPELELS